jgi:hypothetical protein
MTETESYYINNIPDDIEAELEREMDRNPRFDVNDFYRAHGILSILEKNESIDKPDLLENDSLAGISVKLGERALLLTDSLDLSLKSSRLGGLVRKIESSLGCQSGDARVIIGNKIYGSQNIDGIVKGGERFSQQALNNFFKAYGVDQMICDGFDSEAVNKDAINDFYRFCSKYTGPDNSTSRKIFRKTMNQQSKM